MNGVAPLQSLVNNMTMAENTDDTEGAARLRERGKRRAIEARRADLEYWRSLAGPNIDEMLRDPESARQFLTDQEPAIRRAALKVLAFYWEPDGYLAGVCELMSVGDLDQNVRIAAVAALGICYVGTRNRRIGRLLATIICDNEDSTEVQAVAYFALLSLDGTIDKSAETQLRTIGALRIPDDIDTELVASYAR